MQCRTFLHKIHPEVCPFVGEDDSIGGLLAERVELSALCFGPRVELLGLGIHVLRLGQILGHVSGNLRGGERKGDWCVHWAMSFMNGCHRGSWKFDFCSDS